MMDISTFCPEKRSAEKYGVPAKFVLMSEMAEVAAGMIDAKMTAMLNKYPDAIDFIHFSDQVSSYPKMKRSHKFYLDYRVLFFFGI